MAETGWKCRKCGAFNQPEDNHCGCGANKPSFFTSPMFFTIAGGGVLVIILIIVVASMVGVPEKKYKEAAGKITCKEGPITEEENLVLVKIQKQYKISDSKAEQWKKDVSDKCRGTIAKVPPCDEKEAMLRISDGLKLVKEKRIQEAEAKFRQVTESCPRNDEGLGNLGAIYSNQGKMSEAIDLTLKAININPNNSVWHLNLAEMYSAVGDKGKALTELETALARGADRQSLKEYNFKNIESEKKFRDLLAKR